jgi:tetratricopeptide (TPR) repeat protein
LRCDLIFDFTLGNPMIGVPAFRQQAVTGQFVLLWLAGLAMAGVSVQLASPDVNEAARRIASGDFVNGCRIAQAGAQSNPASHVFRNLLGLCAAQEGNSQKAEASFRKSIALNPRYPDARINLAVALARRGLTREAAAQFRTVLQYDPKHVTALYNLGRIELTSGDVRNALGHLERANALAPEDDEINLSLIAVLLRSQKKVAAVGRIRTLVKTATRADVLVAAAPLAIESGEESIAREAVQNAARRDKRTQSAVLALVRQALGRREYRTASALLSAIEFDNGEVPEWYALRGYTDFKTGHPEAALVNLQRALELAPDVEDYYMKMGELMLFHHSYQPAMAYFESGLKKRADSALLHFGLAVSLMAGNTGLDSARNHLETALNLRPDFLSAFVALSTVCERLKDWQSLHAAADRLINIDQNSYRGYYYKGLALMNQDAEAAIVERLFRRAVQLNTKDSDSRIALGELLIKGNRIGAGIEQLEAAVNYQPNNSRAYYHLASAYRAAGMASKAGAAFRRFQDLKAKQPAEWKVLFQLQSDSKTGEVK